MGFARRLALIVPAILLASTLIELETVVRRDMTVGDGSQRLTVGAVRVPLWSAALAQTHTAVGLDDVSLSIGSATYTMKRVEFSGVTSSEADIRALFDQASTEPLWARLERLSAKQVSIPEIVAEERLGELKQRTVFRNVVTADVERGRIRLATASGSTAETTGPNAKATVVQERLAATDTDLAALARIYTQKAGAQKEPLTKIQGSYSVESSVMTDDRGITAKMGRTMLRDLFIRPTEESWSGVVSLISAMAEIDKPSDEDFKRVLSAMLDAADAVQVGFAELNGMEMALRSDKDNFALGIRRIAYTGATASQPADIRLEGLQVGAPDGTMKIDAISYTGFSFQPTFQALRALKDKPLDKMDELDPATIRSLIPTIGTIRHTGLSFDFRVPRENGDGPERVQASLDEAELTADKPLNGIPTNLRISVRNFAFQIPADGKDESLKLIRDLGYKAVSVSYTVAANWNEARQEILVSDVSVNGTAMGQVSLKGVIGGVTRDLFDPDPAVATVAALAATARSVELTAENGGLFDRYLQQEARKQKKTPETLRREFGAAAAFAVPMMLGNSDQAKAVGQAVARFIAKPTRLRITARAKNPAGLGITDLATLSDPAAALEKLEISATIDERL